MKFEIVCKKSDSLQAIKTKLYKEIEMAFLINLKSFLKIDDISLLCKKIPIESDLESKTLENLYNEWVIHTYILFI